MPTKLPEDELKYWLAFSQVSAIGPRRWQKLSAYFPSLKIAWQANLNEFLRAGLEFRIAEELIANRQKINPDRELEKLKRLRGKIITILDDGYPKLLKEVYAPPPLLYYFGNFELNNDFPLAVVGTRKISDYGRLVTEKIVSGLVTAGLTIVSGLALGIDACAHEATLKNNGKTIAVLGSGLNQIYPATNRQLAGKIIANNGAVVSEFPPEMPPLKHNFPQRNRIISGLSLGTLVTEAGIKSGALITAQFTLEQNREIFAVPGSIYQNGCQGPNSLLKMGAKLASNASDIIEALSLGQVNEFRSAKEIMPETEAEKIILNLLADGSVHVDKLVQSARLDISVINSTLSLMEMKGMVKNLGNQSYIKAR
ncbi:MAG: DNA-processing protein DprA [Patescibacteria group bacterium]|jgi:DNA processing protein